MNTPDIHSTFDAKSLQRFSYSTRSFKPAHADLPHSAGVVAQLANESYIEALTRIVYYWGYPAADAFGRTNMWEIMRAGPGLMAGLLPGAPVNMTGGLSDYMSPRQRWVVTPNNDTLYGAGFANLALEPVVIQAPSDVPKGHYWTIQITDVFTNVIHQLGSRSDTPSGKYLLVGPGWKGEKSDEFANVLYMPTNIAGVFIRSFAAHTEDSKEAGLKVLDQMGMSPLSRNKEGQLRNFDYKANARNTTFPQGVTAEMVAADPDASRPQWVNPHTFWEQMKKMLQSNPTVGLNDAAMADQARALIALRESDLTYKMIIDHATLVADADLHASSSYVQVGVDVGNGWQRQKNGGVWGSDWFGRAQAAVIYIFVNDYREAIYFIRGTDSKVNLLNGRYRYTMTFQKDSLPPVDRTRGGFWSLTMYDKDYFMLPDSPNGRVNIGTVNLDADELTFAADGSLTIHLSHEPPKDADAKANWLPTPDGQFSLMLRTYVPTPSILDGTYRLPNVQRIK